jgi:capsular polysaccharide export protein
MTSPRREFLFLQGLAGPFFARLGQALAAAGHGVHRVNFHGGDKLFWPLRGAADFTGRPGAWPGFLARLIAERGVTDIVLFGDCRPMHRAAVGVAGRMQVAVQVFEEGYIRPGWVTFERDGVNGRSTLPRNPLYYLEAARSLPPLQDDPGSGFPSSFGRRARQDVAYNVSALLLAWRFPHYRTHRPWPAMLEYAGWIRQLARRGAAARRAAASLDALRADGRPWFVFPMQLDCDYQVRLHSPFQGMARALAHVLDSFSAYAPEDAVLAVKAHPLDNGLVDWRRRTRRAAAERGLGDRIVFLEAGDIAELTAGARGVVTINSTSGAVALAAGVPVIVLGRAVYDVPGATFAGSLAEFWQAPGAPDAAVFDAVRRVIAHRCLVRGDFFSDAGLDALIQGSMRRLLAQGAHAPVAEPAPAAEPRRRAGAAAAR